MYIKLSFIESVIFSEFFGACIINLGAKPEIIEKLPASVKCGEINHFQKKPIQHEKNIWPCKSVITILTDQPKDRDRYDFNHDISYEVYLDCDLLTKQSLEKLIENIENILKKARNEADSQYHLAKGNGLKGNPLYQLFESLIQKAIHPSPRISPLTLETSFESRTSEDYKEETSDALRFINNPLFDSPILKPIDHDMLIPAMFLTKASPPPSPEKKLRGKKI